MNRLFDVIDNFTTVNNSTFSRGSVEFSDIDSADLVIDTLYRSGKSNNSIKDEPISRMLNCGNRGGLRYRGTIKKSISGVEYIVLYSNLNEVYRPDYFITPASLFMYYGDNKRGRDILDTLKKGNMVLKGCFDALYEGKREHIPPIFIFIRGESGRGVVFKGVAVPGASGLNINNALVKVEMIHEGEAALNYKATFTILDIRSVSRRWVDDVLRGNIMTENTPEAFKLWREKGVYRPLKP